MRLVFQLVVTIVCAGLALASVAAEKSKTGSIQGQVNFCDAGGVEGMQVYIPGLPYVVITGEDGRFALPNLPQGKYDLHYRLGERLLNRNPGVSVPAGAVIDLSVIRFCDPVVAKARPGAEQTGTLLAPPVVRCEVGSTDPSCVDADGDGVPASRDCDDSDAGIYPGAVERCDGRDNNCNGQADENALVMVLRGEGICQAGQVAIARCKDGYSDCDGQVANGCEVDINNDTEHCGGCNENCTPTEICVAGGCE